MSTYTRHRCPNCSYEIEGWHQNNEFWRDKVGEPLIECPNCHRHVRNLQYDEFISIKHPKWFIFSNIIIDFIKSLLFGGLLGLLVDLWIFKIYNAPAIIAFSASGFVLLFVLHCVALKKAIYQSLKRTSDLTYCEFLRKAGAMTNEVFLKQKDKLSSSESPLEQDANN